MPVGHHPYQGKGGGRKEKFLRDVYEETHHHTHGAARTCSVHVLALAPFTIFAGGASEESAGGDGGYKVALIIENTIDDKGWCQSMYEGLVGAQEQLPGAFTFEYSEKMTTVDSESIARQYIADGFDLIIAHGAQYKNMVTDLAAEFPDVSFAFGTSSDIVGDNVFTYMPESEETGYLSGIIAGMLTTKNNIGLVGPVDSGDAARYNRGFVMGVEAVNPDAVVNVHRIFPAGHRSTQGLCRIR